MRPDDSNGNRALDDRPLRVLIISGSDRRQYNCPGVDSKSRALMLRMASRLPDEWEVDYEDIGNVYARARIQSCNACGALRHPPGPASMGPPSGGHARSVQATSPVSRHTQVLQPSWWG